MRAGDPPFGPAKSGDERSRLWQGDRVIGFFKVEGAGHDLRVVRRGLAAPRHWLCFRSAGGGAASHARRYDDPVVRREALVDRVGVRDPRRRAHRSGAVKLRAAGSGRCRVGWQAALTKPGRVSTARWCGPGERGGKAYVRNRRVTLLNVVPAPNLADMGRRRRVPVAGSAGRCGRPGR